MSTLWTPGGEVPVGDRPEQTAGAGQPAAEAEPSDPFADLSDEERAKAEALAKQLAEAREQIAAAPASMVVGNHAMGLYELAAIHLGQEQPKLEEARLAIDALAALVDALEGRLGEHEATLREALHNIRMAFVQVSRMVEQAATGADEEADGENP